jgi:uncharacterized protein
MSVPTHAVSAAAGTRSRQPGPWYREPWPWLLFFPPAVAVVAGTITMGIAFKTFDGVVSDDYYRQGLAINRSLDRDARARERGLSAELQFNPAGDRVRVAMAGDASSDRPLHLQLVRAARSGDDQDVTLVQVAPGLYEGRLARAVQGRWHLRLEDEAGQWRISATAQLPVDRPIGLAPPSTTPSVPEEPKWSVPRS